MNSKKQTALIITLILAGVLITGVFIWFLVNRFQEEEDIKSTYVEIGMSEKEVFRIWGDPDETVLARSGDRDTSHVIYAYDLESGAIIYVVFDPDLRAVEVLKTENSWICLADVSLGIGTRIQVDFSTGAYEVKKPNYSFLFENSPITKEQVCQLEVGMSDSLVQGILGAPDKIIENDPPLITTDHIYYLSEKYQLVITIFHNQLHNVKLKSPDGDFLLSLLAVTAEGTRISFDTNMGGFGMLYPSTNISFVSDSDLSQLNNLTRGMNLDEVIAKIDNWEIKEYQEDIAPYISFIYYANNRSCTEITYELNCNAMLEMVFQDTLVQARIILNNGNDGIYYLLDYVDPIGTRIHYDPETGNFSKILPE